MTEREQTVAALLELAERAGGESTKSGRELIAMAGRWRTHPERPPRTAPVKYVRPTGAPIGLERSLPLGDRDDDEQAELFGRGPSF